EVLDVGRELGRTPIYQTLFSFEDGSPPHGGTGARREHALHLDRREYVLPKIARTDLAVWIVAQPNERSLDVTIEYPTAIYEGSHVRSLLEQLVVLLRGVAADVDRPIARLPLLTDADRRKILLDWNATSRELPDVGTAHELFERRADAAPDRVAVVFRD